MNAPRAAPAAKLCDRADSALLPAIRMAGDPRCRLGRGGARRIGYDERMDM
jgi:hypothetical protein